MGFVAWLMTGFVFVFFLAGVQRIPTELFEACKMDGGGYWAQLWHVTLPGLRGELVVALTLRMNDRRRPRPYSPAGVADLARSATPDRRYRYLVGGFLMCRWPPRGLRGRWIGRPIDSESTPTRSTALQLQGQEALRHLVRGQPHRITRDDRSGPHRRWRRRRARP